MFSCNIKVQDNKNNEVIFKKMEQLNNTEIKKKETKEEIQTQQSKKQTYIQKNKKERNEENIETNENEKKKLKVRGHPNSSINVTSNA